MKTGICSTSTNKVYIAIRINNRLYNLVCIGKIIRFTTRVPLNPIKILRPNRITKKYKRYNRNATY